MPQPEAILWSRIRGSQLDGHKFRRQYGIGLYILDFYCPGARLSIEIDGDSHFDEQVTSYDRERTQYCEQYNIKIIRFTNNDTMQNIDGVLRSILKTLNSTTPSPS